MNIETQPEALRLADALEDGSYLLSVERDATAAELRRLHAIEAEHIKLCRDYQDTWDSRDRLHAENQQLRTDLEAIGAGGVGPLIAAPQPQGEQEPFSGIDPEAMACTKVRCTNRRLSASARSRADGCRSTPARSPSASH